MALIKIEYIKNFVGGPLDGLTCPVISTVDIRMVPTYHEMAHTKRIIRPCVGESEYYISGLKYNPNAVM